MLFLGKYVRVFTLLCTIGQNISPFTISNVPEILTKVIAECTQYEYPKLVEFWSQAC